MNNVFYSLDNKPFVVDQVIGSDAFGYFEGELESKIMAPLSDLSLSARPMAPIREKPVKNQSKTSGKPEKDQHETSERLVEDQTKTNFLTAISRARSFIIPKTVLLEIESRWETLEILRQVDYKQTPYRDFENLLASFESGEIANCPHSVVRLANQLSGQNYSRTWFTKTLNLFVEYREKYYPPRWVRCVDRGLDKVLQGVDYLLVHMI